MVCGGFEGPVMCWNVSVDVLGGTVGNWCECVKKWVVGEGWWGAGMLFVNRCSWEGGERGGKLGGRRRRGDMHFVNRYRWL